MNSQTVAYAMCAFATFVALVVAPIVARRDKNTPKGPDAGKTD